MFSRDISGPSRISKFMPTTSIITIASDIRNTGVTFSPLLLSFLAVASKIAPPAPSAAAGVGLVIPPKIEPRTATIKTSGGNTILMRSFANKRFNASLTPYSAISPGIAIIIVVMPGLVSAEIKRISHNNIKTMPRPPIRSGRVSFVKSTALASMSVTPNNKALRPMPVPIGDITANFSLRSIARSSSESCLDS